MDKTVPLRPYSSAQIVMNLVKKWIKDYNNVAPHSGLGMKSPVEYRKLINQAV
ncbi:MAG: integrase core domain-containing protein [Bdellovibrionales bacterium]|nr:integrase core domain-containing protein [Bdellovibrionales bacterium]